MTSVHFAAGRTGGGIERFDRPLAEEARTHAARDLGDAVEVQSLTDVESHLERLQRESRELSFMDFHSHGGPGMLSLGSPPLSHRNGWERLARFSGLFGQNAVIEFHGCAVAAEPIGELFMAKCAYYMLRGRGGTARGWADEGIATHPAIGWFSRGTPSHQSAPVTAFVQSGGSVRLQNARYLSGPGAAARARDLRRRVDVLLRGRLGSRQRTSLATQRRRLGQIETDIASGLSFTRLARAAELLVTIGQVVQTYERRASTPRASGRGSGR